MKKLFLWSIIICLCTTVSVLADTFGTGENQFEIDFVTISGDSGDLGIWPADHLYTFSGVNHGDYRMGTYEITNDQWAKFVNIHGAPTGSEGWATGEAYNDDPHWTGTNVSTNNVSWYEAAQFVNWLNTFQGHQAAYNFTGTHGTTDYTFSVWDATDTDGTNLYRHKDAYYFLPTEDEWLKAAYWNGTSLQTHATKEAESLHKGDGVSGTGWNYYDNGYATDPYGPWTVGSGSEELNGTFDMMGNVAEWLESHYAPEDSETGLVLHGGSYGDSAGMLEWSGRLGATAWGESSWTGFRVASVPEPTSLMLLGFGGLALRSRKKD